ncbi:MAG: peptidylprolyl isomerase [Planctomycetota bacterium]|nr:peptidylprolyl isomerase [Planctomycetota bacterium]
MPEQEALNGSANSRWLRWKRRLPVIFGAIAVVAACVAIKNIGGRPEAGAQAPARIPPAGKAAPIAGPQTPVQIVAAVNGEEISRQQLGQECMAVYGKEVLESMVNKRLIVQCCKERNIVVTAKDVSDEIDRMAKKFNIPTEQYLGMLKQERGIKPDQYANDIVWPMLALRRLAKDKIVPTAAEVQEAFESQYGEAVKARLIVVDQPTMAAQIRAKIAANPEEFAVLAKQYSQDPSRSVGGMIQPIRRHIGNPAIETAAFEMTQENEISPVIPIQPSAGSDAAAAPTQYVILKCEGRMDPMKVNRELIEPRLRESIVERKLRTVAADIFQQLQEQTKVVNIYNDPELRQRIPGAVALINNEQLSVRDLAEECVLRHGKEVLEGTISRSLLEQALKRENLQVTKQEMETEVARAAIAMGKVHADGTADVDGWLKMVTEEQGLPQEVYFRDSVWPSVALKKLTGEVAISEADMQKGFEANYGQRVRCRAIVLTNQRKAQEVWEQASNNPTPEFFGKLAEQYSIEAASKSLQGQVPPIQKHGGQPLVEAEAFRLKPGELSSIVQVGDKYIILLCEGYTQPTKVRFEEVAAAIRADIHEKKQRLAMAEKFNSLKDGAQIDNFLAGTTQTPNKRASLNRPATTPPVAGQTAGRPNEQSIRQPATRR